MFDKSKKRKIVSLKGYASTALFVVFVLACQSQNPSQSERSTSQGASSQKLASAEEIDELLALIEANITEIESDATISAAIKTLLLEQLNTLKSDLQNKNEVTEAALAAAKVQVKSIEVSVVTLKDGGGSNSSASSLTAPTTLVTTADSASGLDVRYDNDTSVYFSWLGAQGGSEGIASYNLYVFAQANCAGIEAASVTALTTTNYQFAAGVDGETYSFRVAVIGKNGTSVFSSCSGSIQTDTSAPPVLTGFTATTGSGTSTGPINIALDFPADTTDYERVKIFRLAGATAPVLGDCSATTPVSSLINTLSSFADTTFEDATGDKLGSAFSYRACIYDHAGNITGSQTQDNIAAGVLKHVVFVTSATYTGNLGGLSGADQICQTRAAAASLSGTWKALLSYPGDSARSRIAIEGPVYDRNNTLVANNHADLWDWSIAIPIDRDENNVGGVWAFVWTGSSSDGYGAFGYSCLNWTNDSANAVGFSGATYQNGFRWFNSDNDSNIGCHNFKRLYCINQFPSGLTELAQNAFTATTGSDDAEIDLTLTFPGNTSGYQKVEIERIRSNASIEYDCSAAGTLVATITDFSSAWSFTDTVDTAGGRYGYRACVYRTGNTFDHSRGVSAASKGAHYKVFISETTTHGNIGGLAGADAVCQADATTAGLSGTWIALIGVAPTTPLSRMTSAVPVQNILGYELGITPAGVFSGSLGYPVLYGPTGLPKAVTIWTGTNQMGWAEDQCTGFATNSNGAIGRTGRSFDMSSWWTNLGNAACDNLFNLYCMRAP